MEGVPVQPGDRIAGKYRVERVLGEGGMGVVVAAHHEELEQRVAVKFLLPEVAKRADAAERFRREARAAAKIRSEHVVRVIDVGATEDGIPYMVMEYLEGNDVSDELRVRNWLPIEEAVGIILQACEAVAEAHASGIVHRDLKPANLFLAKRTDGSRLVKVLDFGISKSVAGSSMSDLSLTNTSALIGSPLYMSPEQMTSAKNVDTRTDIWALGAILYQLLAGRPPYVADSLPMLCSALINETPPDLTTLRAEIPSELAAVVAKALCKDRNERWSNVADFAIELARFAASGRVHAERASRVLGSVVTSQLPPIASTPAMSKSSELSASSDAVPAASAEAVSEQATMLAGQGTLDSWGKTGRESTAPQSRRSKLPAVIGAVIVAGALAAWGIVHTTARASTATSAAQPPAETAAPQTATAPPPATTAATVEPAASAEPEPSAEALDSGAAPPEPKPKPQATPKAAPKTTRPKAATSTAKPKTPALPDFGGRR